MNRICADIVGNGRPAQLAALLFATVWLLSTSVTCRVWANELDVVAQRGEALVKEMCAACHAIGRSDQSPHVGAPAFSTLDRRVNLDAFMDRLREGLTSGHPDMPTFRFTREDAHAFIAYLRSIQTP
jgi:cytochrome c